MVAEGPGEALAHAHEGAGCDPGMCLRYVRTWWEIPSLWPSAIEAWNGARFKHPGDRNPPKGASLFYRGGKYGHIVISDPDHEGMRSTDCHHHRNIGDDDIGWCERSWGYDYLGWTGDLNGVTLPLEDDGDEDDMKEEDFERIRRIVKQEVWDAPLEVTKPGTGDTTKKPAGQILRELWQKVTKAT